ncbi:sensor histidine kinase [Sphingomonas sp. TDK1]|uniref:sensor histidine kinase n=1 Tax=Sphingomonas sp. TDK1 TaxID=453247 RepID=UPI0007DA37DC|nr:sensor histidine kinase [Sphingomonas sp. TDK1]OAN67101.1 histidine kinase [Sphingomonas sp. TDK1]
MGAVPPHVADKLALAILQSSNAPALLLDDAGLVIAASASFCSVFALAPRAVAGQALSAIAGGAWNVPQLHSLLAAARVPDGRIDAYEMELRGAGPPRQLVINAQKLDYGDAEGVRVLLTVADVTAARISEKLKEDLLREKAVLLRELQHRVANSLQIIASVLLQSARRVQSDEARIHLRDAHQRVMSIATLQQQLTTSRMGEVVLRAYFTQLCASLGASMIHDHERLSLEVQVDDTIVDADISVSLGLIVTELVINALKHAFPNERAGTIRVDYHALGPTWALSVTDDGVGTTESMASAKPGLGTSIVEALARQLDASVGNSDAEPGTIVSVLHPPVDGTEMPVKSR